MADETKEPVKEPAKPVVATPVPKPAVAPAPVAPPAPKPAPVPVAHTPEGVTLAVSKGADGVAIKTLTWRVGDDVEYEIISALCHALTVNKRYSEAVAIAFAHPGK